MKNVILLLVLSVLGTLTMAAPSAFGQRTGGETSSGWVPIDSVEEVLNRWSVDRPLYVRGDIGVGDSQLQDLALWLKEHGGHWTVVLMQSADGEAYASADQRIYRGMDAVEFALGKGLTNRTGFGQLQHPKTGETDGAIFVLFLKERKFSYFSSEAQDRRGLGRSHWVGELDQPAFRAMRNGGRIVEAVKDTVRTINDRLNAAIDREKESARQRELEQQRDIEAVQGSIAHVRQLIAEVARDRDAMLETYPNAKGPLSNPPLDEWNRDIATLEKSLQGETANAQLQSSKEIASRIDRFLNGYATIFGLDEVVTELETGIDELARAPNGVTKPSIDTVREKIERARAQAANGDTDVAEILREADEQISIGRTEAVAEVTRIEQSTARSRMVRQLLLGGAGALAFFVALVLLVLNRWRKPTLDKATEHLKERESAVAKETDGLDQLFSRSADLLGSRERMEQRGYTGATLEMGRRALGDVDDLLIMNKEIRRVIEQSKSLIHPNGLWNGIKNLFSREHFEESVRLLSGAPLKFTRATGVPLVLLDVIRARAQAEGKPLPDGIPDEVVLSFDEIFQAIQARRTRANQALQKLEDALANINDELNRLQSELQHAFELERKLSDASDVDGIFPVPNFFDVSIPSVQTDLKSAEEWSATDAVSATDGPIQDANRKLREMLALGHAIESFRTDAMPQMVTDSQTLQRMGYATQWIDGEIQHKSKWADELFKNVAVQSIAEGTEQWSAALQASRNTVRDAVTLANQIKDRSIPRSEQFAAEIQQARAELAARLKLPAARILVETSSDPSDALAMARKNLEAAATLLRQGKTEACRDALRGFDSDIAKGVAIIDATKAAAREFATRSDQESGRLKRARERCEALWAQLGEAEKEFTSDALRLAYSESGPAMAPVSQAPIPQAPVSQTAPSPMDQATTEPAQEDLDPRTAEALAMQRDSQRASQLLERARDRADACREWLSAAQEFFRNGELLASMGKVREASQFVSQMEVRMDRVEEHLKRLEQTVVDNRNLWGQLGEAYRKLQLSLEDRTITFATIEQVQRLESSLHPLATAMEDQRARNNPFEMTQQLTAFQKRIAELEGMMVADRHGHAEAHRALEGAVHQWQVADQFVRRAHSDNIPDSPATSEAIRLVGRYEQVLAGLQQDFAQDHNDWRTLGARSASLQSELATASKQLNQELEQAGASLESFQRASQVVYDAEHWTGEWGVRVQGSPGVRVLESARAALQRGQYANALEYSRQAYTAATAAIQRAEREVAARRMEEQQRAERERRERMAAEAARYGTVVIGGPFSNASGPSIFGPGGFGGGGIGGGGTFGGGGGGPSIGSSGGNAGGGDDTSGFSRSGW